MQGYSINIEQESLENENFRKVLYTTHKSQLVVMSLKPREEIGAEVHDVDQFIRCEEGQGKAIVDGVEHELNDGWVIVVPAGANHNIINLSSDHPLKLYTLYTPPHHKDGIIHKTKQNAEADTEEFDDQTSNPL